MTSYPNAVFITVFNGSLGNQVWPGDGDVARIPTIIAHQGRSTETLSGHIYQFYFGTSPKDQPFTWGASYDLLSGQLAQERPGPDMSSFT